MNRLTPLLRLAFGVASVILCVRLAVSGASAQLSNDPDFLRYQQQLSDLRTNRPADELLLINRDGYSLRAVHLWVKIGAPHKKGEAVSRSITAFVEDRSGRRVRSLPNVLVFTPEPPARVEPEGERLTKNGEATVRLTFGSGQNAAQVRVSTCTTGR
jgi:hypothetical protein